MRLTNENYFSVAANKEYFSVSQFKSFMECEEKAMMEIEGAYVRPQTKDLLMGSYVDAYFSKEMEIFEQEHPEIWNKRTGELKADFQRCDELVTRACQDSMFVGYMGGEHQRIFTGELFGQQWKVKVDSLHKDMIVDLKLMKDMQPIYKDGEWKTFIDAWGYDIQGYVYQQIVKRNTGKELPFYLAVITKEKAPDIALIHIPQYKLNSAGELVKFYTERFGKVKSGEIPPNRCEVCEWCRGTKVIQRPMEYEELLEQL